MCGGSSSPPLGMQPTHNVRPWQVLEMLNAVFTHHITKQSLPSSTVVNTEFLALFPHLDKSPFHCLYIIYGRIYNVL